ncbi:hypothetical protein MB02_04685 [Croceicoccus estronivorus]|uniref:tetratricopeptide repeat protein n=1 Tax=Croceicoccus estronivorus TaxID=1172626 RepID=UPI00082EF8F2|nr:tetratricopeptide repeat protein [Croceicoccus estronivorus]OCC24773.1 hypothetical protein MB02_04685 [Croceicoccus estronivorus]
MKRGIAASAVMLCFFPAIVGFAESGAASQLAAGRAALLRQDGIAAEVALRDALRQGASRPAVAANMGEAELLQGDLVEARRWLGPEQFVPDQQAYGYRMLGRLEMAEDNLSEAGRAFDKALELTPNDAQLWVDVAQLRYRGGEQLQAIAAIEKAIKLDGNNIAALKFYGQIVRDSIGPVGALGWFERARKIAPDDLDILGEYAATLGEVGRAKEMLAVTRRMIELSPRNPRAFYLQAALAARAGDYALARRLMWRTGDAFRDMPAAMMLSGILEFKSGNLAMARDLFERLGQRQPDNRQVALLIARTLYEAGEMRELVERFGEQARQKGASPYLLTLVGRAYEALENRRTAAVFLDRAAAPLPAPYALSRPGPIPVSVLEPRWQSDPYRADNIIPLVRQLIATDEAQQAVAVVDQALNKFSGSADAQMLAGDAGIASGAYAKALEHYRLSARIRLSPVLLPRMIAAHSGAGQLSHAGELVAAYADEHPMDGRAAGWAAGFATEMGDWQRAEQWLDVALRQPGVERDAAVVAQRAEIKLLNGDISGAREDAVAAYRLQPGNAEITLILARVLSELRGEDDAAVRALRKKVQRIKRAG